uniref:receptor protein-tyrosine kinase n=1 Tax=Gouania willdenowi TaxID=441366 RepID=A0A8C5G8B0_GOUWI
TAPPFAAAMEKWLCFTRDQLQNMKKKEKKTILNSTADFLLDLNLFSFCRQYLRWATPPTSARFSTSDCSGSGLFCTTLTITNATVNETGHYQCSYRDLKAEDGKTSAALYVFVNDYKVPFVPPENEYEMVFIQEGERVVIPCRGSVEDLNVTLNTKYPIKEIHPDGRDSLWDAKTGFTVPSHLISYAGVVSCQTSIGNETFRSPLYFVAVVGFKIHDLTVNPTKTRLSVGERLVLSCTAYTELNVGMEFNWTHSSGALVSVHQLCPHHHHHHHQQHHLHLPNIENTLEQFFLFLCLCVWEVNVGDQTFTLIPVKYSAYPDPSFKWLKNGQALKDDYRIKQKNEALIIRGVTEMDSGNYTVVLTNKITKEEQKRSFQLLVNIPPHIIEKEVAAHTDVYPYGSSPTLRCTARGFPTPARIQWEWITCITNHAAQYHTLSQKIMSSLKIQKSEDHALYRCVASNKVGEDSRVIFFHVTRGLELTMSPSNMPIEEDHVVLRCKADSLIYGNLVWFRVNNDSESEHVASVRPCRSVALNEKPLTQAVQSSVSGTNITLELSLPNASRLDEGLYACQVVNIKTKERTCLWRRLSLRDLEAAKILNNFTDQKVNVSATITLHCEAAGTPNPTVMWTKNNQTVVDGSGVILSQNNQTLTIQRVKKEDSGLYICTACNRRGCDTAQAYLTTEGAEEKTNVELIVPIGSVVIAMFFWLLIVFVIRGRKRVREGDLKTGYLSMILDSEDMPMDEQCERLTYDANKWEFPRDRLKLEGATSSEYRALMSELKILIHIGHHLNVVNLLGACTKPGGPLMVIVEYCKHGNLSSYLKSKRGEYSPYKTFFFKISTHKLFHNLVPHTQTLFLCVFFVFNVESCQMITESSDDDHLTMEDLISYSFQVAKGMEFLSSRKCIHRDLAARNILLSENNVVKICDFGLARDVYKDPDYVRKGDARLPLKWMAPETIFDRVYTTQSDVWSFGVLLWEIFSLGASPYPGVCIDETFCRRLKEGTRMRPPEYATTEIYQTMLDCWLDRPTDRPTFAELVEHLGDLLQASAQQDGKDYIPLTAGEAEGSPVTPDPRIHCVRPQSEENLEAQLHYDKPSSLGLSYQDERYSRPLSIKTFEDIPVARSSVMVSLCTLGSPLLMIVLLPPLPLSQLLRCKSKESVESESSNQTSGYQSGYHSDETDTPIYANEEVILKHNMLKRPPVPKMLDKFNTEIRYSTPPV